LILGNRRHFSTKLRRTVANRGINERQGNCDTSPVIRNSLPLGRMRRFVANQARECASEGQTEARRPIAGYRRACQID